MSLPLPFNPAYSVAVHSLQDTLMILDYSVTL